MDSGTVVEWRIRPGSAVKRGDVVAVVETDKGAIDVEIFVDGVVAELLVQPGAKVAVGTPLALLEVEGSSASPATAGEGGGESLAPSPAQARERAPEGRVRAPEILAARAHLPGRTCSRQGTRCRRERADGFRA